MGWHQKIINFIIQNSKRLTDVCTLRNGWKLFQMHHFLRVCMCVFFFSPFFFAVVRVFIRSVFFVCVSPRSLGIVISMYRIWCTVASSRSELVLNAQANTCVLYNNTYTSNFVRCYFSKCKTICRALCGRTSKKLHMKYALKFQFHS